MKPGMIVGIILIVIGVVGFALGGFYFTQKEKVLDVGPIEATADDVWLRTRLPSRAVWILACLD
jgi:hypothetical protein